MSFAFIAMTFISCSNEDEPEINPDNNQTEAEIIDELQELQDNLTVLNEDGSLKEYIYGIILDESKPGVVSVGVDGFDEARKIFSVLFADTTNISKDGTKAQFSTRQGSASLIADDGTNGLIAHVDFDVDGLKYVDRINFVLHEAWPENDTMRSVYKLGVTYRFQSAKGDSYLFRYVCVREYRRGSPAMLVSLDGGKWGKYPGSYEHLCTESEATEVSSVLRANWDYYKNVFGGYLTDNEKYWIKKSDGGFPLRWDYAINLQTGNVSKHFTGAFADITLRPVQCIKAGGKQ